MAIRKFESLKRIIIIVTIFWQFALFNLPFSQSTTVQFDHITVEDGLSNNSITSILQDSSGFMWFGTLDCLNRWDGHTFRMFKWDPSDSSSITLGSVNTLLQASSGKIWIGTNHGLNRYNPETEKFTRYEMEKNDPHSLYDPTIIDLYEDNSGNLWIATEIGLHRYNPDPDNFTRFMPDSGDTEPARSYNNIRSICPYRDGKIFLGTTAGLLIFDPKTTQFEQIPCPYEFPGIPVASWWWSINKIIIDQQGSLWIGMGSGDLIKYDIESDRAQLFSRNLADPANFSANTITTMCETRNGILWVGTLVDGLNRLEPGGERFTVYKHNYKDDKSLSSSQISALYEDKQGNLWIGTVDKGVNLLAKWRKSFQRYANDPDNPKSFGDCEISDICEDHQGNMWITTDGCFLNVLNPNTGNIKKYVRDLNDPKSISQSYLQTVYCDHSGTIWIGGMSLFQYDPDTKGFNKYQNDPTNPHSHVYANIIEIYEDRDGTLWIGTFYGGLEQFDKTSNIFHRYRHDPQNPNSLSYDFIASIYQDHWGILWMSTGMGLCLLKIDENRNEQFITYRHSTSDPYHTPRDVIFDIYEDTNGRLWLATCAGLSFYDREKDCIRTFNDKNDFMVNCWVYRIKEDNHKNLWLRTNQGLVKINPDNSTYRIYDEQDGLENCKSIFVGQNAFCLSKTGIMYYGCANDIVFFHPDSIQDNPEVPKIRLTNFLLFNSSLPIGPRSILKKSITLTKILHLSHDQNHISFEFAAMDFTAPNKNQYAYKMEGIESEWVYCSNRNYANYTNLDPGEYVFRVKGSNNDGVWNEEGVSVRIIITPPWWKTGWAYAIYVLIICIIIITTWRLQLRRIYLRNELKMKNFETQKLQEVDHLKSHFFANISHEFRTPLTLILGPLERLLTRYVDEDLHQELKIMQRSARRLQRLINQLLDLSKLEAGRMKLQVQRENIVVLLRNFVQAFESLAKLKNIQLKFRYKQKNISGYIDGEKLETIINNIISNAFKFMTEGGKIIVDCGFWIADLKEKSQIRIPKSEISEFVRIRVKDTGRGIPADRLPHIFDRFYQVNDSFTRDEEGSGIGLALTKELVEFHKGEISVSSKLGKGTTFIIRLPINREAYDDNEVVEIATPLIPALPTEEEITISPFEGGLRGMPDVEEMPKKLQTAESAISRKSFPIILIVEDNPDMRTYIRTNLENEYRILEAANGKEGFEKCAKAVPDLVISDVMMPEMDGFQLCAKLKTDQRTSHIPVILLTARAAAEDRIGGLETGADDYIIKPFNAKELQVRVRNLIEQRRKLRERYRKEGILHPREITATSTDQKFLQKALDIMESHISDENFTVTKLSEEIGMSRALLHRKLRALIDMSPSEFIRNLRLNQAASLLAKHAGNITEIAYQVGFNNLSYFARCFHKQFGVPPSHYASKYPHS